MEKDKGRERVQVGGRGVLVIHFFGVYAPLAKRLSLPIRRVRGREAQCYTPKLGTVLTALTIHLIKPETFCGHVFTVALLLFVCVLFWGAHKSLAPRACTLLGGLEQAMLSFFTSQLYCSSVFVSVLNFATSPNSGVKLLGGFLRSEKTIFRFVFSGCASFCWFFFSSAAIARRR